MRIVPLLLVFVSLLAPAQDKAEPRIPIDAISALVERARTEQAIPGVQVAVGLDGRVVFEMGYGKADVENDVMTSYHTRFRTASIAKPMTAVAVMQLVERGKLDLDAAVGDLVEDWPEKPWPIRIRQLLCHTGGIRHYKRRGEATGTRHYRSLAASIRLFAKDPLVAEPGTTFRYTTYGYTLLGLAVEVASGVSFEDYMTREVWAKAKMAHTCVDHTLRIVPNRARGYQRAPNALRGTMPVIPATLHDTSMKVPGGGLRSTAGDLVRFANAILDGTLVGEETRARMFTAQRLADGKPLRYGLGFSIGKTGGKTGGKRGKALVAHGGGQAGTACLLQIVPEDRVVVAVMTNLRGAKLGGLAKAIRAKVSAR